jgi:hypothetical protein
MVHKIQEKDFKEFITRLEVGIGRKLTKKEVSHWKKVVERNES